MIPCLLDVSRAEKWQGFGTFLFMICWQNISTKLKLKAIMSSVVTLIYEKFNLMFPGELDKSKFL